ncbi:MAG: alcohol dehydrogenase catalytic domain-containing protein [Thermoguttaceae bacterium]|jgi:threonine dehydrogenase-like Zn-dependent dehydrogenase
MKAAVLTEYRHIEWKEVKTPEIDDSEVLMKVSYASICGSDLHIFNGEFHPRTSTPLIMGHEFGGTVVGVGRNVSVVRLGDRAAVDPIYWCGRCAACELRHYPACNSLKLVGVDSDGGFGQYAAVKDFMLHKIDGSISDRHAAMIELLSIGFHACKRAGLAKGDTLAIMGAGRVGQSILQAARTITDETIYVVDILDKRLELARTAWENVVAINSLEHDPAAAIRDLTKGRGVDIAVEAVGHAHPIEGRAHPVGLCIDAIRGAGTVCVLGLGDEPAPLAMKRFIWKEARMVASRVTHGEFKETIGHLSRGHLKPDTLISREMPASQAQQAFELLECRPQDYLKILLAIP